MFFCPNAGSGEARRTELPASMALDELRLARAKMRTAVGKALKLDHKAVARPERRTDTQVPDLRSCIEAMGQVTVVARFQRNGVVITKFSDIEGNSKVNSSGRLRTFARSFPRRHRLQCILHEIHEVPDSG